MSSPLGPRWQLEPGYRVEQFSEQHTIGSADISDLWRREAGLSAAEAERRMSEVLFVASDLHGQLAGVSTAYLARNEQLRAELWHFRAFVAHAHRQSNVAVTLALTGREFLKARFTSGADTRGLGVIFEVENKGLQRHFPEARWMPADVLFIGEDARGAHVRVHYFPGALAPEPG